MITHGDSTMAGKPFKVGRFAHTLRVRLMREHLGIDVDSLDEDDLMANDPVQAEGMQSIWNPSAEQVYGKENVTHIKRKRCPVSGVFHDSLDAQPGDWSLLFFQLLNSPAAYHCGGVRNRRSQLLHGIQGSG